MFICRPFTIVVVSERPFLLTHQLRRIVILRASNPYQKQHCNLSITARLIAYKLNWEVGRVGLRLNKVSALYAVVRKIADKLFELRNLDVNHSVIDNGHVGNLLVSNPRFWGGRLILRY